MELVIIITCNEETATIPKTDSDWLNSHDVTTLVTAQSTLSLAGLIYEGVFKSFRTGHLERNCK